MGAGDAAAPEATPTARLFIAVWPSAAVRAELQAWLRRWRWPAGAAVVAGERLHLTLHFLGQVPLARLPMLTAAMADAAAGATRCELAFERVEHWPHGLVVLRASADSAPLARLHAALGASLRQIGLAPQARPYRAHVTLAYVHKDRERDAVTALRRHFRARDTYVPVDFAPIGLAVALAGGLFI
ncbi:MAG TPA: RNA 2',3'-cyclic phosphodiesterase, partial [Rubrivivax sp.]|nr:RNA 2',3'-cyclic phosphodiesterase [Rubrivivax sp.]